MSPAKRCLLGASLCLALALLVYLLIPSAGDPNTNLDVVRTGPPLPIGVLRPVEGEEVLALDANNTRISWMATKTLAGKDVTVSGGWQAKFGSRLQGQVAVDLAEEQPRSVFT